MIADTTLARVAAGIEALDFAEENARLAEIEAQHLNEEAALARANERRNAIGLQLREYREAREADGGAQRGSAIADALIAGAAMEDALAAGPDEDALKAEQGALGLVMADLAKRRHAYEMAKLTLPNQSAQRVLPVLEPLVPEAVAGANNVAAVLASCMAIIDAVGVATGTHRRAEAAAISAALFELSQCPAFSVPVHTDVPADLLQVLSGLQDKGAALTVELIERTERQRMSTAASAEAWRLWAAPAPS